jgi:hypothetical protein
LSEETKNPHKNKTESKCIQAFIFSFPIMFCTHSEDDDLETETTTLSLTNEHAIAPAPSSSFSTPRRTGRYKRVDHRANSVSDEAEKTLLKLLVSLGPLLRVPQAISLHPCLQQYSARKVRNRFDYLVALAKDNPVKFSQRCKHYGVNNTTPAPVNCLPPLETANTATKEVIERRSTAVHPRSQVNMSERK